MKRLCSLACTATALALFCTAPPAAADSLDAVPVLRVGLGPSFHVSPDAEKSNELAAEVTAGAAIPLDDDGASFILNPELGYAYDGWGLHAFNATVGVGYGSALLAYATYNPRLLAGSKGEYSVAGMRNSLTMHMFVDMATLEVGHQFVGYDGRYHHSVHLMFGVNPLGFVFAVSKLADALN